MSFAADVARSIKQLKDLNTAIAQALPEAADAGAEVLEREADRRAPVLTGKLKATIGKRRVEHIQGVSATSMVYAKEFYAKFVEYGVYGGRRRRPFMRPAADAKQREIAEAMKAKILERARRATR